MALKLARLRLIFFFNLACLEISRISLWKLVAVLENQMLY